MEAEACNCVLTLSKMNKEMYTTYNKLKGSNILETD